MKRLVRRNSKKHVGVWTLALLDKTLQPHAAYLYPAVEIAYRRHSIWVTTTMKKHPIQGGVARVSVASCYRNRLRGKLF